MQRYGLFVVCANNFIKEPIISSVLLTHIKETYIYLSTKSNDYLAIKPFYCNFVIYIRNAFIVRVNEQQGKK